MTTQAQKTDISKRLASLVVQTIQQEPPLLAVAIFFETCQPEPAFYLCYETHESCMERLLGLAKPAKFQQNMGFVQSALEAGTQFLEREILNQQVGQIFNPGYWMNPADPVLYGFDPILDAWAKEAFGAVEQAVHDGKDSSLPTQELRSILWQALDEARLLFRPWPPISFVISVDDYMPDLLPLITTRKA
jgi:hypothetical protein